MVTNAPFTLLPVTTTGGEIPPQTRKPTILVIDDETMILATIRYALETADYEVVTAKDGLEGLKIASQIIPDLIISDVMMPGMDGLELLAALRADSVTRFIPFITLTSLNTTDDIVAAFNLGTDDYLGKPFSLTELRVRVEAKLRRPTVPIDELVRDHNSGLLNHRAFIEEIERERIRVANPGTESALACIAVYEQTMLQNRLGNWINTPIERKLAALTTFDKGPLEVLGHDNQGNMLLLLSDISPGKAQKRLDYLARRIMNHSFMVGDESLRLTPAIGFTLIKHEITAVQIETEAIAASRRAALQLDLKTVRYDPSQFAKAPLKTLPEARRLSPNLIRKGRAVFQFAATIFIGLVLPFLIYVLLGQYGLPVSNIVYLAVILALLGTALLIWWESVLALQPETPPEMPGADYPPTTAIIAAYLPNEAATIEATIQAFRRLEYPAPLQIIVAYNTPTDMPIETVFQEIAQQDARFLPLRVTGSTSKAQNVNAALVHTTGEFVGVFDADHHPDSGSFMRAWRWLSNGYDVVQGHCLVRNGDASWVSRMAAVEFETIYAVNHPGRAKLHQFGIFGGSNGYWKTDTLRETRMYNSMLTEDIDSTFRVIEQGGKIASDPDLISRELAPVTVKALWNQRMRWAQGWFQVTLKHTRPALRTGNFTLRQKLGIIHLLAWREIYPWISLQILPIIGYWAWHSGGFDSIDWLVPIFVVTTLVTLGTGPGQIVFVYRVAHPIIKKHRGWFWSYLVVSFIFYTEFKNMIARVSHIKELMGEHIWNSTPRG